jgi:signal transduction histidine kinase/DNA-binding LacI/PurR family transcriptional regulator
MNRNCRAYTDNSDGLPNARATIGYLAFGIVDDVGNAIWEGVADAARRRDVNLICFAGERLCDPNGFLAQANVIYDLVNSSCIDGLVIWTSTIGLYVDYQEIMDFAESYRPLPTVSLGTILDNVPSIQVENYQGVREIMAHLIEIHGYRRLAFARGPENHPYARERYRAYTDALTEHGLPLDLALITPPYNWSKEAGYDMISLLLDQRELRPGIDFEAIVAASDLFALGALEALQARGIQVPEEVKVTGFNDSLEGRAVTPPLTSVAAPFAKQGEQALEMVLSMLAGEQPPERVTLPSHPVVRQSCGCPDSAVVQAKVKRTREHSDHPSTEATADIFPEETQREALIAQVMQASTENLGSGQAAQLVQALVDELEHKTSGAFLAVLEDILTQVTIAEGNAFAWQNVISVLRRHALARPLGKETSLQIENLFQQARVLISEITQRSQLHFEVQVTQYNQVLRTIGQALIATFDMAKLRDILTGELPALGIPSCYLALYVDPQAPTETARLIFAYDHDNQVELEPGDERFRSCQLVPQKQLARKQRYTMITTPLYFEENQLGFALFEMGPSDGATYDTLRGQISSALRGALLLQERERAEAALAQAYARVEEQVEERTHELQQEVSERRRAEEELQRYRDHLEELVIERTRELEKAQAELVRQERLSVLGQLTATVAHEIRNPLGTVRTCVFTIGDAVEREDVRRIERAVQLAERNILRCDSIISELLDYTRERVLQPGLTNIDEWLARVLDEQALPVGIACIKDLQANAEVMVDSEYLRRVIVNVVNNAVDAMQEKGPITEKHRLTVSTRVAGDRLEIQVGDTGCGIPVDIQDRIFEPLFSTKSFGVGLGLPIVRGIMEQHGGGVEIDSQPGRGTVVTLWLPMSDDRSGQSK